MKPELLAMLSEDEHDSLRRVSDLDPAVEGWEKLAEARRERDVERDRIAGMSEEYYALLNDIPCNGEYVHLGICNGDRRHPIGSPGHLCNCPLGHRIKSLHSKLSACDSARRKAVEALRAHKQIAVDVTGFPKEQKGWANSMGAQIVCRIMDEALAANAAYEAGEGKENNG